MPKTIKIYECAVCGEHRTDYNDCLQHECNDHYHISPDEYKIWELISKQVKEYEHILAHHYFYPLDTNEIKVNLEHIRNRLNEFVQTHNLEKFQNPFLQE